MLHVHDLVDYVSQEAEAAGQSAAAYLAQAGQKKAGEIPVRCGSGIRYTVPQKIRLESRIENVTLRLRVDGVYQNKRLSVWAGENRIYSKKRRALAPGEMETIKLPGKTIPDWTSVECLRVELEEI